MESQSERISVLRDQKVVPLVADGPARPLPQPWQGIRLERHTFSDLEIPEHEHRELCLHLQLNGAGRYEWWSEGKNRIERAEVGSMLLLAPGTRDRLHWQGSTERAILSLDAEVFRRGFDRVPDFPTIWSVEDAALRNALAAMTAESAAGFPLGGLYADLLGSSLAAILMRRYAARPVTAQATGGLSGLRLRRAMEFITEHLDRDLRLAEIAAELDLSEFHFARLFRQSTGQSAYQYLLDQRVARAKSLLRTTALPVQEIGASVGWSSAVNFVRAFRQRTGATPGQWRRAAV